MVFSNTFVCTATGKEYKIRGNFTCNSTNVIYLVECVNCKCQYVEFATSCKQRFGVHKSHIKTKKKFCGTARHFNSICCLPINPQNYLKVQLIEQGASKNIESILWERQKYWQYQGFINTHGMNSISDLYSRSRKGCRKK